MLRFDFYTKNQIGGKIMAYNKTSEERKWRYWKEQEDKKLRELGMEEEKIQKAAPDGQGRFSGRAQIPGTSG